MHDRNGWLYVVVGGAGLLATVVLPVTKRRHIIERETRPEVAHDRGRVARSSAAGDACHFLSVPFRGHAPSTASESNRGGPPGPIRTLGRRGPRRRWRAVSPVKCSGRFGRVFLHGLSSGDIASVGPLDEEPHFDYADVYDTTAVPTGDDPIDARILLSAAATDRWTHYRLIPPPSLDPEQAGTEGLSSESYQPPIYYGVLAIIMLPAVMVSTQVSISPA